MTPESAALLRHRSETNEEHWARIRAWYTPERYLTMLKELESSGNKRHKLRVLELVTEVLGLKQAKVEHTLDVRSAGFHSTLRAGKGVSPRALPAPDQPESPEDSGQEG